MGLFNSFKKAAAPKGNAVPSAGPVSNLDHRDASLVRPEYVAPVMEKQVLFVGVGVDWFQAIERDWRRLEPKWGCEQVAEMSAAIKTLASGEFHAVVLNAAVGTDAPQLAALEKQSQLVRVVLCAPNDRAEVARWNGAGATLLPQSTDATSLSAHINRLARVQEWMTDAGIKKLLAQCRKLPAMPKLFSQVTAELSSPSGSIEVVAECIAKDPVMTAKLLQVVNSAFFALGHEVSEPIEAVMFLGAERTRSLILLAGVFTQFESVKCPGFSAEQMWNHSLQVGALARTITMAETKNAKLAEAAFTAGLVHDMGKLILAANVPTMCASVQQIHTSKQVTLRQAELQVLGTTHAELAACLLGNWGLPLPVLEAVAWHHAPARSDDEGFSLLTAVHAANIFAYELAHPTESGARPEKFDQEYLGRLELGEHRNDWRKACNIPAKLEEDAENAIFRARRAAKRN